MQNIHSPELISSFFDQLARSTELFSSRCEQIEARLNQDRISAGKEDLPVSQKDITTALSRWPHLAELLENDSINDILINGTHSVYIERAGKLERATFTFASDEEVYDIAQVIVGAMGRTLNARRPLADTRLADGSRVNIIAPPLAVDGTTISIRKFPRHHLTLDDMIRQENVSPALGEFLKICGKCRINIVISGGTGSGKTTLLNAISQNIENTERVVTIEDAAELRLQQPHVVRLETLPSTKRSTLDQEVSIRDLVRNALRMRPDRIIVGEVRGEEAFDMMQAMNTGHEGSLTTVHSNHPRDALSRLENMIGMANVAIPLKSLRYQMTSALHLIVQVSRMRDGVRRVTHVSEIVGMESDVITMHDLFNFVTEGEDKQGNIQGKFVWNNIMPRFLRRVAYYGELDHLSSALKIRLPKL